MDDKTAVAIGPCWIQLEIDGPGLRLVLISSGACPSSILLNKKSGGFCCVSVEMPHADVRLRPIWVSAPMPQLACMGIS